MLEEGGVLGRAAIYGHFESGGQTRTKGNKKAQRVIFASLE